jgi:hypothetical protein
MQTTKRRSAQAWGDVVARFAQSGLTEEAFCEREGTEMKNLQPDEFEVIGQKVSYRLAQRPGSTVVLKYVRPLIKILQTQSILCAPAPWACLRAAAPT